MTNTPPPDDRLKIIVGDARTKLAEIPANTVQCVITSPPYYGLRDYDNPEQIGTEDSLDEYLNALMSVMEQCRRVLKPGGTLFLNIGDTYSGSGKGRNADGTANVPENSEQAKYKNSIKGSVRPNSMRKKIQGKDMPTPQPAGLAIENVKRKSLAGVPARMMIRMIEAGWVCRNEIIWHKSNCMPNPAKDRWVSTHETIYFFSKNRRYDFYMEEVMVVSDYDGQLTHPKDVWTLPVNKTDWGHIAVFPEGIVSPCIEATTRLGDVVLDPFAGSGTTGAVALKMGRKAILIETNPDYAATARKRCSLITPRML